jgi:hypothetical protein
MPLVVQFPRTAQPRHEFTWHQFHYISSSEGGRNLVHVCTVGWIFVFGSNISLFTRQLSAPDSLSLFAFMCYFQWSTEVRIAYIQCWQLKTMLVVVQFSRTLQLRYEFIWHQFHYISWSEDGRILLHVCTVGWIFVFGSTISLFTRLQSILWWHPILCHCRQFCVIFVETRRSVLLNFNVYYIRRCPSLCHFPGLYNHDMHLSDISFIIFRHLRVVEF